MNFTASKQIVRSFFSILLDNIIIKVLPFLFIYVNYVFFLPSLLTLSNKKMQTKFWERHTNTSHRHNTNTHHLHTNTFNKSRYIETDEQKTNYFSGYFDELYIIILHIHIWLTTAYTYELHAYVESFLFCFFVTAYSNDW